MGFIFRLANAISLGFHIINGYAMMQWVPFSSWLTQTSSGFHVLYGYAIGNWVSCLIWLRKSLWVSFILWLRKIFIDFISMLANADICWDSSIPWLTHNSAGFHTAFGYAISIWFSLLIWLRNTTLVFIIDLATQISHGFHL